MKRPARWKATVLGAAALGAAASIPQVAGLTEAAAAVPSQHVLLISVDGLHASDLSQCEANNECPNLARLASFGTTYANAHTSQPSDSAPGLMALATGGDPKLTGVYYDDTYDRTMFTPPAQTADGIQTCTGTPGVETQYFENVDVGAPTFNNPNGTRPVMNAALDPAQFAYAKVNGKCGPVAPNDFLRTNSIFSVAHQAGMYTAWADKHPVYNAEIAGHGTANTVDDPFNTEINADIIPGTLTDTRGTLITFPHPNPTGDPNGYFITDFVENTEAYDQIKVDAILNQIDGMNSANTHSAPVPAIFGMNFQTVSVAQKLIDPIKSCQRNTGGGCDQNYFPGGYEPGTFQFTPQLSNGLQWVDQRIGDMVSELNNQGVLGSTTIIITAKHGQSPIDPGLLQKIGHAETTVMNNAGVNPAVVTDDDVALVWLKNQGDTNRAVSALNADKAGANTARVDYVLSGDALAAQFNSPLKDPRTPNLIVQPIAGTIYSKSGAKVAEHGGFAEDDTHVAMVVTNGANIVSNTAGVGTNNSPVRTYQVAPTILSLLGLDPNQLDSVRTEGVQVLPGL